MSENLREQMFQAMKAAWRDRLWSVSFDVTWRAVTDAAWGVVGPELDRLRAEVERLTDQKQRLSERAAADVIAAHERAKDAEAKCDVLRARLAKVEALAREWESGTCNKECSHHACIATHMLVMDLDEALASVPEPSASEPACTCPYTPEDQWLSAASCGYGSGYEPGSMQEFNPDCPVHGYHTDSEPAPERRCSQCGRGISELACGPTHALLYAEQKKACAPAPTFRPCADCGRDLDDPRLHRVRRRDSEPAPDADREAGER